MKNLKFIATMLVMAVMITACGDDGGNNGDISKAKSLAKKFEDANKFSQGYVNPSNTREAVDAMVMYGNNANDFYQMHRIGCFINGKSELLINERQHTAELIVGADGNKARYLQFNELNRCHIAQGTIGTPFGYDSWKWGSIPSNVCQKLRADLIVKRVDKNEVRRYMNPYGYGYSQHAYGNPNNDYWNWKRPDYSDFKEEDSYFDVHVAPPFGRTENLRYRSSVKGDHFHKYGDKAVFVSENIRKKTDSDCDKVVYYGRRISKNALLHIQFFTTQANHK